MYVYIYVENIYDYTECSNTPKSKKKNKTLCDIMYYMFNGGTN